MANLILDKLSIGYNKSVIQPSLTLEAREGEMICLLGQNGCGKSTLIRTLAATQRSGVCSPIRCTRQIAVWHDRT